MRLLKQGYDPYIDNTELHHRLNGKNDVKREIGVSKNETKVLDIVDDGPKMTIREAFDFGLARKTKLISETIRRGYENKIKNFIKWLDTDRPDLVYISELDKKVFITFLNGVLDRTSARNSNNFRTDLSSIVQVLVDNDIIGQNFIKKIPPFKTVPERNKTYSQDTQEKIFAHLEQNDPILLLYIKFISFNFLRPIEV